MSTQDAAQVEGTRVVDGRTVPAAGKWAVDPSHSTVEFVGRHLMVTKVRGRFTDYEASLTIGERPEDSKLEVSIQVASITTGDVNRDGHLTSADFFDVENYPTISFVSTSVSATGENTWRVIGDLTIRDTTKPVELVVVFDGVVIDPWGNQKAIFAASTEVDREDWGLTWNQPLANGGVLVGKKVKLELEVQAAPVAD